MICDLLCGSLSEADKVAEEEEEEEEEETVNPLADRRYGVLPVVCPPPNAHCPRRAARPLAVTEIAFPGI